ncbi:SDR family NAD(P)-dependent oxidoreductase [uncultured Hyphomonas sp.]|uniref:SDR family oxidoreductase n=1 Tax=uncultured Hyphomonas sp. TaxID=225298 RepID=UPI002AABD677|nr:SDR family NAD(P)-dependent oxidoreductase [uncultured Hyphomonas sp.]
MADNGYVDGKVIVVTGGGGGFGRLISQQASERGAKMVCADINIEAAEETAELVRSAGGEAIAVKADVTSAEDMAALAAKAVEAFGRIDVMINNAGIMPLAFFADHKEALGAWHRCIDINIRGVLNGMVAVHDQMLSQGRGHIINVSSIYGNFPVVGAGVYGASKAAVNFLSEAMRMESRGRIKVTIVKPTGVPGTGLGTGVINPAAVVGIVGQNMLEYGAAMEAFREGKLDGQSLDPDNIDYLVLDPAFIAQEVLHAIDQPWGVSVGEVTVRAAGDHYLL